MLRNLQDKSWWSMNYFVLQFVTIEATAGLPIRGTEYSRGPFQHKEELAMRPFDTRVATAYHCFISNISSLRCPIKKRWTVIYTKRSGRVAILNLVERIREVLFATEEQLYAPEDSTLSRTDLGGVARLCYTNLSSL